MKRISAVILSIVILLMPLFSAFAYNPKDDDGGAYSHTFADVYETDWYCGAAEYCFANGLMNGTSENIFSPNLNMTRAMLVTTLYRLAGAPAVSGKTEFSDIGNSEWYCDAVLWACGNGIVNGFADGTFRPNESITREQTAAILYRYWLLDKSAVGGFREYSQNYRDFDKVSEFAYAPFGWAIENGIIKGTASGYLNPQNFATRAEISAVLMRFCKYGLYIS